MSEEGAGIFFSAAKYKTTAKAKKYNKQK